MILESTELKFIDIFDAMVFEQRDRLIQNLRELADLVESGYPVPDPNKGDFKSQMYDYYLGPDCDDMDDF